jgi:hypothetical protein
MWTSRQEDRRERLLAYVGYLRALHEASEGLRDVVLDHGRGDAAASAAGAVVRDAGAYPAREEVVLVATMDLAVAARDAFYRLRDLRDLAAGGAHADDDRYRDALEAYRVSLSDLRAAMRRELDLTDLGDWREIGHAL